MDFLIIIHYFETLNQDLEKTSDILEGLKKGEEESYQRLFYEYFQPLCYFANKYLKDLDLSKDLVQGVFTHLFEKRESLQIHSSLKSYLFQTVANRSLNELKSAKIHARHEEDIKHSLENSYQEDEMETMELEAKINFLILV